MFKVLMVFFLIFLFSSMLWAADENTQTKTVIAVIESAYLNRVFNIGDPIALEKGFHKDFSLKGIREGQLSELAITKWIKIIKKKKANGKFPPESKYGISTD